MLAQLLVLLELLVLFVVFQTGRMNWTITNRSMLSGHAGEGAASATDAPVLSLLLLLQQLLMVQVMMRLPVGYLCVITGTIVIEYNIDGGIQTERHAQPNEPFTGTRRRAYLPDCLLGRQLLRLLIQAFVKVGN